MIWQTNFVCICLFYRLCQQQEHIKQEVGENPPTEAPQVSTDVQVPVNIFTGTLQSILGFASTQVWVLVDDGYASQ